MLSYAGWAMVYVGVDVAETCGTFDLCFHTPLLGTCIWTEITHSEGI